MEGCTMNLSRYISNTLLLLEREVKGDKINFTNAPNTSNIQHELLELSLCLYFLGMDEEGTDACLRCSGHFALISTYSSQSLCTGNYRNTRISLHTTWEIRIDPEASFLPKIVYTRLQ